MGTEHEKGVWISADEDALGDQLSDARVFVRQAASDLGVPDGDVEAVALAVHEAIANAIEHGQPCHGEGAGRVELRVALEKECAVFTVCDCGRFAGGEPRSADLLEERGRGLLIMGALMDRVELLPGKDNTIVRMEKQLA